MDDQVKNKLQELVEIFDRFPSCNVQPNRGV